MTQSSQSRGGIRIKSYHSPFLYILITLILLTILCFTILSIRLSLTNAVEEDTGKATLTNVAITQAGTGQSVTIDGATMDETTYGSNTTRRTILNNNVVRYSANYQVATPGTITLSITLPANNTIDEATVSPPAGCLSGSLSKQTVNGEQSYTNNKATCTVNSTDVGQSNWEITAYLWGGNNEQIQPTVTIDSTNQSVQPEPIAVMGKANYILDVNFYNYNDASAGVDKSASFNFVLYSPYSETGVLGLDPINSMTMALDTSAMPSGWEIRMRDGYGYRSRCDAAWCVANSGGYQFIKNGDESLTVKVTGIVTAVPKYPSLDVDHHQPPGYVWSSWRPIYDIPTSSISVSGATYTSTITGVTLSGVAGSDSITPSRSTLSWSLSSTATAGVAVYLYNASGSGSAPGWDDYWNWGADRPSYTGEGITLRALLAPNKVPSSTYATDMYYCQTWDASVVDLVSSAKGIDGSLPGGYKVEYGVIDSDDKLPNANSSSCGRYGDQLSGVSFYDNLAEAQQYSGSIGKRVNAIRMYAPKINPGNSVHYLYSPYKIVSNLEGVDNIGLVKYSVVTNEWSERTGSRVINRLVPGLLSHALTAEPSSINPGKEDHITITTKTYNKDTNSKITTTLPKGLIPKGGSFTITKPDNTKAILVEGDNQDYTLSSTCSTGDGCTITFNLDHIATTYHTPITGYDPILPGQSGTTDGSNTIANPTIEQGGDGLPIAADNNGNGITHSTTPIEFDILVDSNVPTPSTLSITSQVSGTGTNYASSTFRSATASLAVATPPKVFGYNLTASSSNIYASDPLTYHYTISNLTNTDVDNLAVVDVLPYDGDSRGTVNLTNTKLSNIAITSPDDTINSNTSPSSIAANGIHLYYTTSQQARELEKTNPNALGSANDLNWQELDLSSPINLTNTLSSVGDSITAIKLTKDNLTTGRVINLDLTLTNIQGGSDANPTTSQTKLANDLTYINYLVQGSTNANTATHQVGVTTTYLGSLLSMSLDKATLSTNLASNSVAIGNGDLANPDSLTNVLNLTAKTNHGYTITLAVPDTNSNLTNTVNNQAYTIPTINTKPTKGTPGWAVAIPPTTTTTTPTNLTWHSLPNTTSPAPLAIYQTSTGGTTNLKLPITYGIATAQNTIAGPYTARVVYTVAAGL